MARAVLVALSLALLGACVSSSPTKKYDYEADGWIHPDPDNYDGIKVWNGKKPAGDSDEDEDDDGNTALKDFLVAHPEWADEKNAHISPQAFGRKPITGNAENAPSQPPGKKRAARSAEL